MAVAVAVAVEEAEPDEPPEVESALRLKVAEPSPEYDVMGSTVLVALAAVTINVAVLVAPGMLVPVGMLTILEVPVAFSAAVAMATWLLATS